MSSSSIMIPDQYITNNMTSYSGSYSDRYFYGNVFSIPTQYSTGSNPDDFINGLSSSNYTIPNTVSASIDFKRTAIGASVDRSYDNLKNKTMWFSDYLNIVYGRYIPSRTANYVSTHIDLFEHYYDSYVASPVTYFKAAGKVLTHNIFSTLPSSSQPAEAYQYMSGSRFLASSSAIGVEDFDYPDLMTLAKRPNPTGSLNISLLNSIAITQSVGFHNGTDELKWMTMYPFQSTFKNVQPRNLLNVRYLSKDEVAEYQFLIFNFASYSYPVTSSILGTINTTYYGTSNLETNNESSQNFAAAYSVVLSDTVISGTEGSYFESLDFRSGSATSSSYWNDFVPRRTTFRLEHQNNLFFGIGETKDFGPFVNELSTSFVKNAIPFIGGAYKMHVSAPIIRGFKYGLVNSNVKPLTAQWRRDKFGQFRDMLEQRQYSKLYFNYSNIDSVNGTNQQAPNVSIVSPIKINFVSGSDAAIIAENYVNWNPDTDSLSVLSNSRDSGIYDSEYKAGQPFDDSL